MAIRSNVHQAQCVKFIALLLAASPGAAVHASPVQLIECIAVTFDGPVPTEYLDIRYAIRRHVAQVPPVENIETDYWSQAKFEDNGIFDVTVFTLEGEPLHEHSTAMRSTVLDGYGLFGDTFEDQALSMEKMVSVAGWTIDSAGIYLEKSDGSLLQTHLEVPDQLVRSDWDAYPECGGLDNFGTPTLCKPECVLTMKVPGGGVECQGSGGATALCTHGTYIGRITSISYEEHTAEHGTSFVINAGLNDAWVSEGAPYQGLFITVFPELALVFVAWFTFDSERPPASATAVFGSADQRWVTALGSYDGNRAELKAELTTGGSFNSSSPKPTQDTDYGTVDIEMSNCNLISVEYDFPSANETGSFTATRAIESNVPLCDDLNVAANQ